MPLVSLPFARPEAKQLQVSTSGLDFIHFQPLAFVQRHGADSDFGKLAFCKDKGQTCVFFSSQNNQILTLSYLQFVRPKTKHLSLSLHLNLKTLPLSRFVFVKPGG